MKTKIMNQTNKQTNNNDVQRTETIQKISSENSQSVHSNIKWFVWFDSIELDW